MCVLVGVGGSGCLQENFLQMLPTEQQAVSLTQALQQAQQLQATQLFKFNGEAGQRAIMAATDVINQMACGKAPALGENCTSFLTRVKAALQFFARHTDGKGPELTGEAAILAKLKLLEGKAEEAVTFADLEPFHVFHWLVPASHKQQVEATTKLVLQRAGQAFSSPAAGAKSAASASSASCPSKKHAKPGSTTDLDAAMSVFK